MPSLLEIEAENFLAFLGAERPKPDSVFILVMGITGSGKTSFIADCTGQDDDQIGHDLASLRKNETNTPTGTNSVAIFRIELQDRDVYLIDTPGFDDTNREDVEILTAVSHYLSVSYANNVMINGILYFYRISDTRIGSVTRRNLEMMKALCGEDAYENIAIMTTMWSSDPVEHEKQRRRENELRDIHLSDMLQGGSQIVNHSQSQTLSQRCSSAKNILAMMFDKWRDTPATLQIQHEMVNLNLTLNETSAGKILEQEIRRSHPRSSERELESSEVRRILVENNQALDAMRLSLLEIHKKQEQRFIKQVSTLQNEWKNTLREKEEECRQKELEYRARILQRQEEDLNQRRWDAQESEASSRRLGAAESALAYERETFIEIARQGRRKLTELGELNQRQHNELMRAKRRDQLVQEDLEKLKSELKDLREETQSKLDTTDKVKHKWVGPLLQGLATGGLGLVGTCITAGKLKILDALLCSMTLIEIVPKQEA
ncbi:P-loop containing nucleoside triphosphate hydrolase protein [Xylaria arbuscula]|nr:P-loop containing nucleoside triphosphate hydrolase protein [Xylaria arbuscula]